MREPMPHYAPRTRRLRPPSLPVSRLLATLFAAALVLNLALACACPRPAPRSAHPPARATQTTSAPLQTSPAPSPRPTLLPIADLPQLDLAARVGPYLSQDAAWVPGQPLAVNRDFDFMLAMSLEGGLGAGLAAKKRQDENRALAQQLAVLPPIDSSALLDALCSAAPQHGCADRAGQSIRIYGLLFGDKEAGLLVVLETQTTGEPPTLHAVLANATSAWHEPGTLQRSFARAMLDLARDLQPASPPTDTTADCQLTAGAKLTGQVLATHADRTVLQIPPQALQLSCPTAALGTRSADPSAPHASPVP